MRQMAAAEFKARCLRIMDDVSKKGEPVLITKKGRPVAKLVPVEAPSDDVFGCLKGKLEILGDIESPILAPEDWEANR